MKQANGELRDTILGAIVSTGAKGMTLRELEKELGVNYYTARNYVKNLHDNGFLITSPVPRFGTVYIVPAAQMTPAYLPPANAGSQAPGSQAPKPVKAFSFITNKQTPLLRAHLDLLRDLAVIYRRAANGNQGVGSTPQEVSEIRKSLRTNIERCEATIRFLNTLLNDERLWDNRVTELAEDPALPCTIDELFQMANAIVTTTTESGGN